MKEEKIVIFDLDDVHPEEGFGLEQDNSSLKYIKQLNKVFGLKATLFVPLNWHGNFPIYDEKYKDWISWLKRFQVHGHEIAAHGLYHTTNHEKLGDQEFLQYNQKQTDEILRNIKDIWIKLGVDVKGIRYPGWGETTSTETFSYKYYDYIATHTVGEKQITAFGGIKKLPYNLLLHNLYDIGHDVYIIHGHVGNIEKTENNLNLELYLQLVDFLKDLEKKYDVKYMTHGEWVKYGKNKK